ncbi:MAG: hypothetical protein SVR08_11895 [Spirochaetota bacterium]|nr:hypothetical protein [Spirochaetota bacterium]
MICIAEIKTFHSERDDIYIHKMDNPHFPMMRPVIESDPAEYIEVKEELVYGKEFINANGERVCIGMSKKVQDLIGLPFEAFDNMTRELDKKHITISRLISHNVACQKRLSVFATAGLFERLKYLFTKKIKEE